MAISSVSSGSVAAPTGDGLRSLVQPAASSSEAQKVVAPDVSVRAQAPSPEHIAQAVKQVNDAFTQKGQNIQASIERDQATGINVVTVQDMNTKEVISQYPSKTIIAIAEAMSQSQEARGRLINVSA
jgi:uncharacterized FlaG/YvyC family protein